VELGERRIPLQIAKQVKGRRVYGGQNTHMSLKVVSVGVLPLIFAYSFLAFPGTIAQLIAPNGGFTQWWNRTMYTGSVWYMIVSALLIIAFTFFYSSISFDPKQQAEQLQQQGAVIPGQRGKNVRQYLQNIVNRLNLFAALFLSVLAAVPTLLLRLAGVSVPFFSCPARNFFKRSRSPGYPSSSMASQSGTEWSKSFQIMWSPA
jgi:preprotein translocase subunit SecY